MRLRHNNGSGILNRSRLSEEFGGYSLRLKVCRVEHCDFVVQLSLVITEWNNYADQRRNLRRFQLVYHRKFLTGGISCGDNRILAEEPIERVHCSLIN